MDHLGIGIQHVQHLGRLEPGPLPDFEVVEVMSGGYLHGAAAQFGIGMFIRDNGDKAPRDRQLDHRTHERSIAFIRGIYRNGHVRQHRFRARSRDGDVPRPIRQGVAEMPEFTVDLARLDFKVGDGRLEARIPVHQPLVAI